jgi:methyl-accepting chemotaxis protein
MNATWTFGRRLAAGFGFTIAVFIVLAAVSSVTTDDLIENQGLVSHTHEIRMNLANLLSQLTDAETGQRGYIITGVDAYLAPYEKALQDIRQTFAAIQRLTVDNPSQQRRLAEISPLIDSRLALLRRAIELRRTGGFEAGQKLVASGDGLEDMQRLRALVDDADQEEQRLLDQRAAEAQASAKFAQDVNIWGSAAAVIIVIVIAFYITRSLTNMVGSAVGQVQSSSTELQAAATQQATGAKEQATATSEITTTISELLATSRQIAESARRVADIAEKTAEGARNGRKTVDGTQESIQSIQRQVEQIVGHMLDLGKKSQEIGGVLDIVSELAEQTNILAINATIEAAGAGEAGKRFAVVADEIRKLADRVGGSAKEIRSLVEDVRAAVNTTVMATETGSKAVDAGTRQFGEVARAFGQISDLVATTTEAAREIELSTKQQSSAVEQVNSAIGSVAQASKETEMSSAQTLQTSSQLTRLSQDLLRMIRPQAA